MNCAPVTPNMGKACLPFGAAADNPAAYAGPSVQGPNAPGKDGCGPNKDGICYGGGAGSDIPVAGPDTVYYATGDSSECCCVTAAALITLWSGSAKAVSSLVPGDQVYGYSGSTAQALNVVNVIALSLPTVTLTAGAFSTVCTLTHQVLNSSGVAVAVSALMPGSSQITITSPPPAPPHLMPVAFETVSSVSAPSTDQVFMIFLDTAGFNIVIDSMVTPKYGKG